MVHVQKTYRGMGSMEFMIVVMREEGEGKKE